MHNDTGYPDWLLQACQCSDDHPLKKSIFWILDQAAQSDLAGITNIQASDSERHFMAGRMSAIQDLHEEWKTIFSEANRPAEDGD